jgi:hypothetical protein
MLIFRNLNLKQNQGPGMVVHICNPSTQEAETELQVQGRPYLKIEEKKNGWGIVQTETCQAHLRLRVQPPIKVCVCVCVCV